MKKTLIILQLSILLAFRVLAQEGDIDSLFDEAEDVPEKSSDGEEPAEDAPPLISELISSDTFQFGASFDVTIGYSPGWEMDPEPLFSDSALMLLSSRLTLDARVSESFRFLQSYNVAFPAFEPKVSEFFADFDFGDRVFFRVGRQNLTWGISRYYKFTNLHARLPENFGKVYEPDAVGKYIIDDSSNTFSLVAIDPEDTINDEDSYSVKVDIPVGIGGFQGLMFTRNGFFSDASIPAADELGWGGYFNLAMPWADMTLGGFYHKDLNLRGFFSASTTLFNRLELYTEAVVSYDQGADDLLPLADDAEPDADGNYVLKKDPDSLDWGVNIGFFADFLKGMVELSGEYYYNGEETELEPLGTRLGMPLITGHNLAGGFGLNLHDNSLKFEAYTLYNISENTGVAAPVISWKGFGFLELKAAFPFVYGSENGTYMKENPDALDRRFSFVLTAKVSGRI